jgi:hypothetical protein
MTAHPITSGTDLLLGIGVELNLFGRGDRIVRFSWTRFLFDKVYLDTSDALSVDLVIRH